MTDQVSDDAVTEPMPVQFGVSDSADFEDMTWTFSMRGDFKVAAGEFAIMPMEAYQSLVVSEFAGQSMSGHLGELVDEERTATEALRASHAALVRALERIADYDVPDAHAMLTIARKALADAAKVQP